MSRNSIGIILGPDLELSVQLHWAQRLAEARSSDIVVFLHAKGHENRVSDVSLNMPPEGDGAAVIAELVDAIEKSPSLCAGPRKEVLEGESEDTDLECIHLEIAQIYSKSLRSFRRQMLSEISKRKLKLITVVRREMEATDADLIRERQLFLRYAPCDVVLCFGVEEGNDLTRILVPVAGGRHCGAALGIGRDLAAASGGKLTALRVNPSIGPDAIQVGDRRLETRLKKALGNDREAVRRRVVIDDQVPRGVRTVWDEGEFDLVVVGASRVGVMGSHIERGMGAKLLKSQPNLTIAITSAGSPIRNRVLGLLEGQIARLVPQIDRDDRVALVDRVQSSSNWDFDFFALMVLSTIIASIGLIQDSSAVVIGAMLVAPLMTPLLGLGLALVQGNPILARISTRSVVLSLFVSLMVGALVGLVTPGFQEPTREMLARGGPGTLDIFVAFAAGLAAAYASSRTGLLAALPGVAIAAALVPPIATSGLALALGDLHLAFGALLLFVINTVTIVLASMISLWAVGLRSIKKVSRGMIVAGSAVLLGILALGIYLGIRPPLISTKMNIPDGLRQTIQKQLGNDFRLEGVGVAYDEIGIQLNVRVVGERFVPEEMAQEIRTVAREHYSKPVRVRLLTQVDADVGSFLMLD